MQYQAYPDVKKGRARLGALLIALMLVGLLAACGNDQPTANTSSGTTPVQTSTTQASSTTTQATQTTQAAATTTQTTTQAASNTTAATTTAANSTQAATTQAVTTAVATTQAAANLPPVGNNYPSGPAPTVAPPTGGLVNVTLQVPDSLKKGTFASPLQLKMPPGYSISLYAQLGGAVRFGAFSPDGKLFISEKNDGKIIVINDNNGVADPQVWADGLNGPHGLAFHEADNKMYLYVADADNVTRFPYANGQPKVVGKEVVVKNFPTGEDHTTRSIAFGPDNKMYIAAGSTCNVCEEPDPHFAAVTQYNDNGTGEHIFATGLRNEVGIEFNPQTGELWGVENSRDDAGASQQETNNIPPEEVNIIQDKGFYGWPYCYSNQVYDAQYGLKSADICKTSIPPALPMQAHSAPLGFDFYNPQTMQFPADFKGDAIVGFHGSWDRQPPTGFKVVRVRVQNGRPTTYEDFITGFMQSSGNYWGRPVDAIVAPDGSVMITDDYANAVYRVTYKQP